MGRVSVRKADLDRVLKSLDNAGKNVARVELRPGGEVVILTGDFGGQTDAAMSQLDRWRARNAARSA